MAMGGPSAMSLDTTRVEAHDKAAELRAALRAMLAADFDVRPGDRWAEETLHVDLKAPDSTSLATVIVKVDVRNFRIGVGVTVRPSWVFRRGTRKTVTYWAGRDKGFAVDLTKVVAKITALAASLKADRARETDLTAYRKARALREHIAAAPIRAFIADRSLKDPDMPYSTRTQLHDWSISEGTGADGGFVHDFSLKLGGLSLEQTLAILDVLTPGKPTGGNNPA